MSDETNVATVDNEPVDNPAAEVDNEVRIPIEVNGVKTELLEFVGKIGKGKGKIGHVFPIDLTAPNPFSQQVQIAGAENWNAVVFKRIVKQACKDASHEAYDPETGLFSAARFAEAYREWFVAPSRKGGEGIADLRDKSAEIMQELAPLAMRVIKQIPFDSPEDEARYQELSLQFVELQEKMEAPRYRKGKKKAA